RAGDMFVYRDESGHFLLPIGELSAVATLPPELPQQMIGGQPHIRPDLLPGTRVAFDPASLTLSLELPATVFGTQQYSLATRHQAQAPLSSTTSLLLNYDLDAVQFEDNWRLRLFSDQTLRRGPQLLENSLLANRRDEQSELLRLRSRFVQEDTSGLRRFQLGDIRSRSGDTLGSSLLLGGIAYGSARDLDPGRITFPTASIGASLTRPSEVELYVGDNPVYRGTFAPGEFELSDFNYYGGLQTLRLVITDPVTGEQRTITRQHYFASRGLAAGLVEFEWRLGLLREAFGSRSNSYEQLVGGGYYRRGINNRLTLGTRLDLGESRWNAGLSAILTTARTGTIGLAAAYSEQAQHRGAALSVDHQWQRGRFGSQLFLRWAEDGYRRFGADDNTAAPRQYGGAVSLAIWPGSSITLSTTQGHSSQQHSRQWRLALSRSFNNSLSMLLSGQHRDATGEPEEYEIMLGLRLNMARHTAASATALTREEQGREARIDVSRDVPQGTGLAWRFSDLERRQGTFAQSRRSLALTRKGRHLESSLSVESLQGRGEDQLSTGLGLAGSLGWMPGHWLSTRQIRDAFGVVTIDSGLSDVRVYHNHRLVGRTDNQGRLLVPELNALIDNVVSLEQADIPLDYRIDTLEIRVAPMPRSGALLSFPISQLRVITGGLIHAADKPSQPLEHRPVIIQRRDGTSRFMTGYDGRFYLEDLPTGDYPATVHLADQACRFILRIPQTEDSFIELGAIPACTDEAAP
ncbi:MAG: fimbria/pilus outer membrane usher protein, partial [Candidatus Competibacterales bacterium]|nr:fimbria/pilus outer membrane usher protein [Candidatus Competibacterales bacterium]